MLTITLTPGASHALQAGAAKEVITLDIGTPLAGHLYRQGRDAQRQEGTFHARSLYLEDEDLQAVLVSLDLYAITTELRTRILAELPDPIAPENVILTATHTHSGPGGLAESWFHRQLYGRYMESTIEEIVRATKASIQKAIDTKRRATIGYEIGEQKTLIQNALSRDGVLDNDLGVIRIDDSDGNPIAIIGTFSGKPATLRRDRGLVMSPDFPGVFCDELESMSAADTIAFFLSGASGDQACKAVDGKTGLEWTNHIGKELAQQVKAIANKIDCRELPITMVSHTQPIPEALRQPFLPDAVPFHALGISRLLITFVPGEPLAAFKEKLSVEVRRGPFRSHILVGLSNDNLMELAPPTDPENIIIGPENRPSLLSDSALDWCIEAINALTISAPTQSDPSNE